MSGQIYFYTAGFELFGRGHGHLATLTCTLSTPVLARPVYLAVPARPALNRSGLLSHTLSSIAETGSWDSVCWCDRVKMAQQCVVICS